MIKYIPANSILYFRKSTKFPSGYFITENVVPRYGDTFTYFKSRAFFWNRDVSSEINIETVGLGCTIKNYDIYTYLKKGWFLAIAYVKAI